MQLFERSIATHACRFSDVTELVRDCLDGVLRIQAVDRDLGPGREACWRRPEHSASRRFTTCGGGRGGTEQDFEPGHRIEGVENAAECRRPTPQLTNLGGDEFSVLETRQTSVRPQPNEVRQQLPLSLCLPVWSGAAAADHEQPRQRHDDSPHLPPRILNVARRLVLVGSRSQREQRRRGPYLTHKRDGSPLSLMNAELAEHGCRFR